MCIHSKGDLPNAIEYGRIGVKLDPTYATLHNHGNSMMLLNRTSPEAHKCLMDAVLTKVASHTNPNPKSKCKTWTVCANWHKCKDARVVEVLFEPLSPFGRL